MPRMHEIGAVHTRTYLPYISFQANGHGGGPSAYEQFISRSAWLVARQVLTPNLSPMFDSAFLPSSLSLSLSSSMLRMQSIPGLVACADQCQYLITYVCTRTVGRARAGRWARFETDGRPFLVRPMAFLVARPLLKPR